MIPVLGITVTIVNEKTFESLIKSINYPVNTVSIVCNHSDFDYFLKIRSLCVNDNVKDFSISHTPCNLGCAGSWNYHIKANPDADYWILSNDDIVYGESDLEKFHNSSLNHDITFNTFNKSSGGKYSFFSLSRNCIEKVGLFDENIYPTYFEDDDYDRRILPHNLSINYVGIDALHIHEGTSKHLNPEDSNRLKGTLWTQNAAYLNQKIKNGDMSAGIFSLEERANKIFKIRTSK